MKIRSADHKSQPIHWPLLVVYVAIGVVLSIDFGIDTTDVAHTPPSMVPPFISWYANFSYTHSGALRVFIYTLTFSNLALLVTFLLRSRRVFSVALALAFFGGVVSEVVKHAVGNPYEIAETGHGYPLRLGDVVMAGLEFSLFQLLAGALAALIYTFISLLLWNARDVIREKARQRP